MEEDLKLSGYSAGKELAAQRVKRGSRTVYIVSLPIELVPVHLPVPDPDKPIGTNRQVRRSHAQKFGDYWEEKPDAWTVPPLVVDTAGPLTFTPIKGVEDGSEWGKLVIPNNSQMTLRTLDGQHRILGWEMKARELLDKRAKFLGRISEARRTGDDQARQLAEAELKKVEKTIARMHSEQVTLEILTEITEQDHKAFFVTIADNALGINASERTRLDEENITSVVAKQLMAEDPLLKNRVDERRTSAGKNSKDLMSLSNVSDIVRHTCFGIKGRVTKARELTMRPDRTFDVASAFFSAMREASPELEAIVGGTSLPKELRQSSLLGSITIWRCLAGAYHSMAVHQDGGSFVWDPAGHAKFRALVTALLPALKIKDRKLDARWYKTGFVNPGELAPRSRAQDLRGLTDLFVEWGKSSTPFVPPTLGGSSRAAS